MSTAGLISALFLPILIGTAWLQFFWQNSHCAARIGYGYLLGVVIITSILHIWGHIGLTLNFWLIATLVIAFSIIPLLLQKRIKKPPIVHATYTTFDHPWQKVLWFLLTTILIFRYGGILLEVIWRPLYPWDAWVNWAPKAKTWFALKELVPFVSKADWAVESIQSNAYTLGNSKASTYPPLVPLIQTWTALGIGSWKDNLVNLPWALCLAALSLAFYGQGRMLGAKPHISLFFAFLMLSTPYINVHTALAGYADLWLATFYCLAVMAFINWSITKNGIQAALTLIFALACIQTKNPGVIWAATLLPAFILAMTPSRWRYALLVAVLASTGLWFYSGGFSTNIPVIGALSITPEYISLPGIGNFDMRYHPVGEAFTLNLLTSDNWHLLGWLIPLVFVPVFIRNLGNQVLLAPSLLLLCGFMFIFIVFFFTSHYKAALDNTTINRASVHMLPAFLFYLLFSYIHYKKQVSPAKPEL